mgnify:CR=1 FL=1
MAWYDRGKKKKSKPKQPQHKVTCVKCGKEHPALFNTWTCNGRGEVLCYGTEESCFNVLFEMSKQISREERANKDKARQVELSKPPEGW